MGQKERQCHISSFLLQHVINLSLMHANAFDVANKETNVIVSGNFCPKLRIFGIVTTLHCQEYCLVE